MAELDPPYDILQRILMGIYCKNGCDTDRAAQEIRNMTGYSLNYVKKFIAHYLKLTNVKSPKAEN